MKNAGNIFLLIIALGVVSTPAWSQSDSELGLEYRKKGDNLSAIKHFEKALDAGDKDWWIYNNLASCYLETEQYDQALTAAREGYSHYPERGDMKNKLILILFRMAQDNFNIDLEKSEYVAKEILKIDTQNFNALHYYGLTLRNSEDSQKIHLSVDILIQAFELDPSHEWVLHNLLNAFSYSIRRYVKDSELEKTIDLSKKMYRHYQLKQQLYAEKKISLYDIHWMIAFPFLQKYGSNLPPEVQLPRIPVMETILELRPDNFYLKYTIGEAISDIGQEEAGYLIREEAYDDYIDYIKPVLEPVVIQPPLRGRILNVLHVPSLVWQPSSHSGLRKQAMDFILVDEEENNIGVGKSVFVPVAGTVTRIVNDDDEHSRIEFQIDEDLNYYMSHFQPGSIVLQEGQHVQSGTFVGLLGKLRTMVPHLHIEFTNEFHVSHPFIFEEIYTAEGVSVKYILPEKGEVFLYH